MAKSRLNPFSHIAKRKAADDPEKDPKDKDDQDAAKKARKAGKKAEGDDEDEDDLVDGNDQDEEDEADPKASAARERERRRCRAIVLSEAGKANPVAAFHMALDTATPRGKAISTLAHLNAATAPQEEAENPYSATARAIVAAGAKARGEDPRTSARDRLRDRMGGVSNAAIGSDAGTTGPGPSMADRIIAAGKKARGEA